MQMNLRGGIVLCVLASVAGCGGQTDEPIGDTPGQAVRPVSHSRAALSIATNTETALQGLVNAGAFLAESSAVAETLTELGGGSESCTASLPLCPADGSPCNGTPIEECTSDPVTTADLQESQAELQEGISEFVDELSARLFSEENIESQEEKSITYLLGPEDVCGESTDGSYAADGTYIETTTLDPECVDSTIRAQIRLRVTSPSDGDVDITVQLTEERYEPIVFELHQKRLAITFDLGEFTHAIEALGEDLGGLESLEGRAQLELVENGSLDYSVRFNVLEAIEVVANDGEGNFLEMSLGQSSPTTEFRVDGNAKTISADYDYGALRVAGPLQLFADMFGGDSSSSSSSSSSQASGPLPSTSDTLAPAEPVPVPVEPEPEEKVYTGMIEFLLAGLSGSFSFAGNTDVFQFTNLGLGDETTTLTHDGNTLLALDVNKDDGRRFDVTVEDTESGLQFTFSPTLDVSLALQFMHVADQLDVDTSMLNDTLRFWFDGESPSIVATEAQVRVASGTLHMSSTAAPEHDVEVSAGMCLLVPDDAPIAADGESAAAPAIDPGSADLAPAEAPVETEPVPVETTDDEEAHFLSEFEVGACQ